jgi:23S rRNA (cytosine1962-C5)-methyltransferase
VRRLGHERGVKVAELAARSLRGGHPWVFRDSMLRGVEGLEPGATIRVLDPDGGHIGWGLFEPEGAIAVRLFSRAASPSWDDAALAERVSAAAAFRASRLDAGVAGACRLVHAEADGLPGLAVDRLGDYLLVYKYSRVVESYLDRLIPVLERVFEPAGIYLQDRVRPVASEERRPAALHVAGKPAPPDIEIEEDGLRFLVDPSAPVSPGLFLDLREGRRLVEALARGKSVLNLFSFTGSFGLRAVRGGAREVTNVDAAPRSHARCRQNLVASGMNAEACAALVGDVFKHLERLRRREARFDLVVVDPPPFSRVKGKVFSALRHWHELIEAVVGVLARDGEILAVSNASKLSEDELMIALGQGAVAGGREARLIGELGLPPDFPVPPAFAEGRYLDIKRLHVP